MVKEDGKLFRSYFSNLKDIDFGHFLGNIKRKFGFKRERAPFVLTPDFLFVMKQSKKKDLYADFIKYCTEAYLIVRRNSALFLSLFQLVSFCFNLDGFS